MSGLLSQGTKTFVRILLFAGLMLLCAGTCFGDGLQQTARPDKNDRSIGPTKDVLMTIIEYTDFAANECVTDAAVLRQFQKKYPEEVRLIIRPYPTYAYSMNAARAAEAAGRQGYYFEAEKFIFDRQGEWARLATEPDADSWFRENIPLAIPRMDGARWEAEYDSEGVLAAVQLNLENATAQSVPAGRTTVYINNHIYTEAISDSALFTILEDLRPAFANVCIFLFNDKNGNTILEDYEYGIGGAAVSIGAVGSGLNYSGITTGNEQLCFPDIPKGDYNISVAPPTDYNPTTEMNYALSVTRTGDIIVNFGAQISGIAAQRNAKEGIETDRNPVMAGLGILLIAAAGALVVYFGIIKRNDLH